MNMNHLAIWNPFHMYLILCFKKYWTYVKKKKVLSMVFIAEESESFGIVYRMALLLYALLTGHALTNLVVFNQQRIFS